MLISYFSLATSGHHVMDCTVVNDKAYFRIDNVMTFGEALIACSKVAGGNLMSVRNFDEYRIMVDLVAHVGPFLPETGGWLGITLIFYVKFLFLNKFRLLQH